MTQVARFRGRPITIAFFAILCAVSFAACSKPPTFSGELACGDLVTEDGLQVFVESSCGTEHTAERFFYFESPFDRFNTHDIEVASGNYCLQRFLSHYDPEHTWDSGYDFEGVVPGFDEWNQGNRQISCIAFITDGSVFP